MLECGVDWGLLGAFVLIGLIIFGAAALVYVGLYIEPQNDCFKASFGGWNTTLGRDIYGFPQCYVEGVPYEKFAARDYLGVNP